LKNYDDIINVKWPPENYKRERMPLSKRAKIFLPFAALVGHSESLENVREKVEKEAESFGEIIRDEYAS